MIIRPLKYERFHTPIRWAMEDSGFEFELRNAVSSPIFAVKVFFKRSLYEELESFAGFERVVMRG